MSADARMVQDLEILDFDRIPWPYKRYEQALPRRALPVELPATTASALSVLAGTARPAGADPDRGRVSHACKPRCHLEAVEVRELDVEQDELRLHSPRLEDRGLAVGCLPDDLEPVRLEEGPGVALKLGVVIDDQDRARHPRIVARRISRPHRGEP